MSTRRMSQGDLTSLLLGASVLGTGGGGSFSLGRAMVEDLGSRGMDVELLDPMHLSSEALGVSTAILGGGITQEELEKLDMISDEPLSLKAARVLEKHLGRPIDFVFAIEIGPQNTMEAVRLAAFLGVPILDGDCAGRAVPELQQTTLSLYGIPLPPYVVATFQGDLAILAEVSSDARSETLCRAIAVSSGGIVCLAGFPVTGHRMQEAIIPGTLGRCMKIGELLQGVERPAERIAAMLSGRVAFRGRVKDFRVECRGSFFWGQLDLDGLGDFAGEEYRVGIQNEYMWAWKHGRVDIRCPDPICVIDTVTGIGKVTYGHGFENAIEPGEDLTVLHLPCDAVWRSDRGRALFPPPPLP